MPLEFQDEAVRFNSRTREGCDISERLGVGVYTLVSIHAPGRGATKTLASKGATIDEFQFTHPGGVRRCAKSDLSAVPQFQFTHPGGVRLPTYPSDRLC